MLFTAVFYVYLFAVCIFFGATSYFSSQSGKIDVFVKKENGLVASCAFFAVALFFDGFSSFAAISDSSAASSSGANLFQAMMLSGAIPSFFRTVFALVSGVYFLILTKGFIKEDERAARHKYLALAPVGWAGFRLIYRFVEQISYIRVSDLFLELIMLAGMITFFMALAQVASGVYSTDFRWRLIGIGLPAGLISLTVSCSRLVMSIFSSDAVNVKYHFELADFIFGIFVFFFAKALIENCKRKEAE